MRTLTPAARREIEAIRRTLRQSSGCTIGKSDVTIEICESNEEMWRTVLDLALRANEAIEKRWNSHEADRVKPVAEIAATL